MDNTSINAQMMMIRQWAEKTDSLHEAQAMHLRVYWQVIAPCLTNEVAIDFLKHVIEFRTAKNTKIAQKNIRMFMESVEYIVGKSWRLRLKRGNACLVTWKHRGYVR